MISLLPYPYSFEHRISPQNSLSQTTVFAFPLRGWMLLRICSRSPEVRSSPSHDGGGFSLRLACTPDLIGGSWRHLNRISGNLPTLVATREGAGMQTWVCQSMLTLQADTRRGAWGGEVARREEPPCTNKRCVLTLISANEACMEPVL